MARTIFGPPNHPYYQPISPPPYPRKVPLIEAIVFISDAQLSQRLGGLSDFVFAQILDEHSVILVPREYIHDDPEQLWRREVSALCCFRTCIAYELLSGDDPNIARYMSRDPWTGFPILSKPTGLPLETFFTQHRNEIFLADSTELNVVYFPLLASWILQALSALEFIHSHDSFFYNDLCISSCWLSSDLSLSLVGFLAADFQDANGEVHVGFGSFNGPAMRRTRVKSSASVSVSVMSDLFDWATFVFMLMTGKEPERGDENAWRDVPAQNREGGFPVLGERLMGRIVRRCWMEGYESAKEVRRDVEGFLRDAGFVIEGGCVRGFNAADFIEILT